MNIRCSNTYRKYNSSIPEFLLNKPRFLVNHCLERLGNASETPASSIKQLDGNGNFRVKSQSSGNNSYLLSFGGNDAAMPSCECEDWKRSSLPCKHFLSIFLNFPKWQWDNFPLCYRESPFITLDKSAIAMNVNDAGDLNNAPQDSSDTTDKKINNCKINSLPPKRTFKRTQASKCRELLDKIRSLTFLVRDQEALEALAVQLKDLHTKIESSIEHEDGFPLEQEKKKSIHVKEKKGKDKRVLDLPKEKRRKKKFSGRVGSKADMMRKATTVNLSTLETSHSTKQTTAKVPRPQTPNTSTAASPSPTTTTYSFMTSSKTTSPSTSTFTAASSSPSTSAAASPTTSRSASPSTSTSASQSNATSPAASPSPNNSTATSPTTSAAASPTTSTSASAQSLDNGTSNPYTFPGSSNWRKTFSNLINAEELECLEDGKKLNDLIIDASLQ